MPASPSVAAAAARSPPLPPTTIPVTRSAAATLAPATGGLPVPPATFLPPRELSELFPGPDAPQQAVKDVSKDGKMLLELADGSAYEGFSFGADKTISGECVFQTGAKRVLDGCSPSEAPL